MTGVVGRSEWGRSRRRVATPVADATSERVAGLLEGLVGAAVTLVADATSEGVAGLLEGLAVVVLVLGVAAAIVPIC